MQTAVVAHVLFNSNVRRVSFGGSISKKRLFSIKVSVDTCLHQSEKQVSNVTNGKPALMVTNA